MVASLPPLAPFPTTAWREQLVPSEWADCLDAWLTLVTGHLAAAEAQAPATSGIIPACEDESVTAFLTSFARELSTNGTGVLGDGPSARALFRASFSLTAALLRSATPPPGLAQWEFLADLCRVYGAKRVGGLVGELPEPARGLLDSSLAGLKKFLTCNMDAGIRGDLGAVEQRLSRVNHLIHASPAVAAFFLAGSDFLDALVVCFRVTNPPLRRVLVATTYLCLAGLAGGGDAAGIAMLTDQLYALKGAADTHRAGPTNAADSLVPELVSTTPLLQQIPRRLQAASGAAVPARVKKVLADLAAFRKAGGLARPKRSMRRRAVDKGKGPAAAVGDDDDAAAGSREMRIHLTSQISQVQDLFPELGSAFVAKLLDEFGDDPEQAIAHLLDDSLPAHLADADRSENLSPSSLRNEHTPSSAPPRQLPVRQNIFDQDELDKLEVSAANLHVGKRGGAGRTADDVLRDRSSAAPRKAAILAALAAFDSDDDERDDTYDAADVGGTVGGGGVGGDDDGDDGEEALFRAYRRDPGLFARDAATRRSQPRAQLRRETGMTDEAVEGWAVMLARSPQRARRLEAKYGEWSGGGGGGGAQPTLPATSWRANPDADDDADADTESGGGAPSSFRGGGGADRRGGEQRGRGGGRGRGRGGGGRGGRGGGDVAGPTGDAQTEAARRRKEASKGSRANHNRRDQRARKMARGGFAG